MTAFRKFTRVLRVLVLAGLVFAAFPAASALAQTPTQITIGQTGGGIGCVPGLVLGDTNYVVPEAGTITSFSFQSASGNSGQQLAFLVLRHEEGNRYSVVGTTGLVTLAGTGLETFPASPPIAVQEGDILGLWTGPAVLENCAHYGGGGLIYGFEPEPGVGDTVSLPIRETALGVNVSATLTPTAAELPTSKAQCMHGGWQSFGVFRNQGDCVSFVATGGKNPPSGS